MKTLFLLPHKFKSAGWVLLSASAIAWLIILVSGEEPDWSKAKIFAFASGGILEKTHYFKIVEANVAQTIIGILFITGGLLTAFSKEKEEDEYISQLRLSSFQWAFLINYLLLLCAFLFVYDMPFLQIMIYNMFVSLILFIARFNFLLLKNKNGENEK